MINFHFHIERWKYNKEYELYVSTDGRLKDKHKQLVIPKVNNAGYFVVQMPNGYWKNVHVIVIETWRGKSELTVDHINSNKRDCRLKNLEYVTQEENIRRAQSNKVYTDVERLVTSFLQRGFTPDTLKAAVDGKSGESPISAPDPATWYDVVALKYPSRVHNLTKEVAVKRILQHASTGKKYLGFILKRKPDGTIIGVNVG